MEYVNITKADLQQSTSLSDPSLIYMDPDYGEVPFFNINSEICMSEESALESLKEKSEFFHTHMKGSKCYKLEDIKIWHEKTKYVANYIVGFPGVTVEMWKARKV